MTTIYCAPLISVVIPTLNRTDLLENAISSVEAQTYKNIEIIVVDDFSSKEIPVERFIEKFKSVKLVFIRNTKRMGGAASRNIGIDKSRGDFICFLDDDDVYMPNKIKLLLDAINKSPDADAAFGKIRVHNGSNYINCFNEIKRFNIHENIMLMNMIHNNATLIRRDILNKVKFLESLTRYQDLQFNIELSLKSKIIYVNEFVAEWRVDNRQDKITHNGDSVKNKKDVVAFLMVYKYLRSRLSVPTKILVLFKLKSIKMLLMTGQYFDALKILFSDGSIFNIFNVLYALRLRKAYWTIS